MAATDPATQSHSSRNQLELPLERHEWLCTPRLREEKGFVSLEIRRMRRPASPHDTKQKEEQTCVVYETQVDMIDDFESGMPPYIIFRFEFKQRTRFSNHQSARLASTPLVKKRKSSSQSQVENDKGEGSSSINRSPSLDAVDLLLKERKTLSEELANVKKEQEHKRARYDQLMDKDLAQKLKEERAKSQRLKDGIGKLQAAVRDGHAMPQAL
ncbi:hypothetical protein B0H16DRAFT_1714705 [Mycena metata]|uniref:Uncharacterized protein n=1 Tax=Mycena metata TaxID=1033252 RepID=A0AAD7NRD4_9AGAR|nr:hypothetical protein B0H16DRAFT_1714705 [Mycena metata]